MLDSSSDPPFALVAPRSSCAGLPNPNAFNSLGTLRLRWRERSHRHITDRRRHYRELLGLARSPLHTITIDGTELHRLTPVELDAWRMHTAAGLRSIPASWLPTGSLERRLAHPLRLMGLPRQVRRRRVHAVLDDCSLEPAALRDGDPVERWMLMVAHGLLREANWWVLLQDETWSRVDHDRFRRRLRVLDERPLTLLELRRVAARGATIGCGP